MLLPRQDGQRMPSVPSAAASIRECRGLLTWPRMAKEVPLDPEVVDAPLIDWEAALAADAAIVCRVRGREGMGLYVCRLLCSNGVWQICQLEEFCRVLRHVC